MDHPVLQQQILSWCNRLQQLTVPVHIEPFCDSATAILLRRRCATGIRLAVFPFLVGKDSDRLNPMHLARAIGTIYSVGLMTRIALVILFGFLVFPGFASPQNNPSAPGSPLSFK